MIAYSESFEAWRNRTLFERIPYGRLLGMAGISFFVILDIFVYPEKTTQLMVWRFSSVGLVLATAILDWTQYGKKNAHIILLLMTWALTLPIIQNAIILGPYSQSYFFGVILVLTGAAAIFPLSWRVHVVAQAGILAYYFIANFLVYGTQSLLQTGFENILYLLWAASLLDISIFAYERLFKERHATNIALEDAYRKISEKERMKTTYLLNISEGLRSNLDNTIDQAKTGLKISENGSEIESVFKSIEGSGKELSKLIGDMLDMSALETGAMEPSITAVDIKSLCEDSVYKFKSIMGSRSDQPEETEIEVKTKYEDNLGTISTDAEQLKHIIKIILNFILENSRKKRISLACSKIMLGESEGFLIEINADDIVIPPEERVRAFIPYSKVRGGIGGIQLPIARLLSRNIGGDINLAGEFNRGITFQVRLPKQIYINKMFGADKELNR
jgi:signal transduction histidine kinase